MSAILPQNLFAMAARLIILIGILAQFCLSLKECNDFEECKETNLISDDGVLCSAESACFQSTHIESTGDIECTGNKGCYQTQRLYADGNIYCYGGRSCGADYRNEIPLSINASIIDCGGMYSCAEVTNFNARELLYCGGWLSCQHVTTTQHVMKAEKLHRL